MYSCMQGVQLQVVQSVASHGDATQAAVIGVVTSTV
jgi:hypothetical protein